MPLRDKWGGNVPDLSGFDFSCNAQQQLEQFSCQGAKQFICVFLCASATLRELDVFNLLLTQINF
jgi:hypothetical protein